MKKKEYKPLLFDTTLRNPQRIKDYLKILYNYNNIVLNDDVIHMFVHDLLKEKLYEPKYKD